MNVSLTAWNEQAKLQLVINDSVKFRWPLTRIAFEVAEKTCAFEVWLDATPTRLWLFWSRHLTAPISHNRRLCTHRIASEIWHKYSAHTFLETQLIGLKEFSRSELTVERFTVASYALWMIIKLQCSVREKAGDSKPETARYVVEANLHLWETAHENKS